MKRIVPPPPDWHRDLFTVGVTGTNGKTTTTAWIAAALRQLGAPVPRATTVGFFLDDERLPIEKTYDGFIAAMKLARDRGAHHAAIELTSEALAGGFAVAWPCRVGVFTNLTHDHLDAHGSPEHYLASKAQLFVSLPPDGTAVVNACDPVFKLLCDIMPPNVRVLSYAVPLRGKPHCDADILATHVDVSWEGTRIHCTSSNPLLPKELCIRAIGSVYAENALAALLGAYAAGVPVHDAVAALAQCAPPPGRFEVIHTRPYVVVDYAHSPDALARTVTAARALTKNAKLTVVFGAGGKRDKNKRGPMGKAARLADTVILTSDNPRDEDPSEIARAIAEGLHDHSDVRTIVDRQEAIFAAIRGSSGDDVILIAGKGHETEQTIGDVTRPFSDVDVAKAALR